MIIVAGMWELGWNVPINEINLWKFLLRDFNIKEFYMSPITGIKNDFVNEVDNILDVINLYKNYKTILIDEGGDINLKDFKHPSNDCIYLFGKANSNFPKELYTDYKVSISTNLNAGLLWPHQAAGIILYDRLIKCQ